MAVGKNKRLTKGGTKGAKKKVVDPFSKKDWYAVQASAMFNIRKIGKTLVTRTQGTKIASDGLKGRVFKVSLADLQNDEVEQICILSWLLGDLILFLYWERKFHFTFTHG
ncbi:40S ribosomal protein S3a-like [Echinops telfairi]|uniref:40S ribosomal protein S3a-like n=1 Tax=Echinops telfairi TaxID=9371 RepID=A0AC55CR95_ECHTE|nr:40S ribosomal protein S3a-like [Echinops telfairi]